MGPEGITIGYCTKDIKTTGGSTPDKINIRLGKFVSYGDLTTGIGLGLRIQNNRAAVWPLMKRLIWKRRVRTNAQISSNSQIIGWSLAGIANGHLRAGRVACTNIYYTSGWGLHVGIRAQLPSLSISGDSSGRLSGLDATLGLQGRIDAGRNNGSSQHRIYADANAGSPGPKQNFLFVLGAVCLGGCIFFLKCVYGESYVVLFGGWFIAIAATVIIFRWIIVGHNPFFC